MFHVLQRRSFCTRLSKTHDLRWRIKQVTKSNFVETLDELKRHISQSDCIAISLQKTGSFSIGWQRVLPFDTRETAYFKAKRAAERFQVFQFAVCPFSIKSSKVAAHPYNFLLFPRDESAVGMATYSFSCRSSYLTSMAQEGFDFNACIYDGISYSSRAQELANIGQREILLKSSRETKSSPSHSVADAIFMDRVKTRINHWRDACNDLANTAEESLVKCLRKLILGSELYGSRRCINIDVCTERQAQLVFQVVEWCGDDLVPLKIPAKGVLTQAVRIIMTSSKEDKDLFMKELQDLKAEEEKEIRGFRDVIELVSASQKPILTFNSLDDLTFVHSKFLGPLPPDNNEFTRSLHAAFPNVLDISHLLMEMCHLKKLRNSPAAISHLKKQLCMPVDIKIPLEAPEGEVKIHGYNALRMIHLFMNLCLTWQFSADASQSASKNCLASILTSHANSCNPWFSSSLRGEIKIWAGDSRKVSSDGLVFLWGFGNGMSASSLKTLLLGTHDVLSGGFDVQMVDGSCAVVAFWRPGASKRFLGLMKGDEGLGGSLREMVSGGLKAAGYGVYVRACGLALPVADLADSLDRASAGSDELSPASSHGRKPSEVYWDAGSLLSLEDL